MKVVRKQQVIDLSRCCTFFFVFFFCMDLCVGCVCVSACVRVCAGGKGAGALWLVLLEVERTVEVLKNT